jgi:diaminopimelate epimerase
VEHGYTDSLSFTVSTVGGKVHCLCHEDPLSQLICSVTVEMGKASFDVASIPMLPSKPDQASSHPNLRVFTIAEHQLSCVGVSMGNPHCVVLVPAPFSEKDTCRLGPLLEHHECFPQRTNVQFAWQTGPSLVEITIWERGAGFTLASGSSACAVAAAFVFMKRCPMGMFALLCKGNIISTGTISVRVRGGVFDIVVREDWTVQLRGPVSEIASGYLSDDTIIGFGGE